VVRRVALGLIISSILMVSGVSAENTGISPDETAIRKAIESYVEAYNRGDASAAASHWSRDGSYLTQAGEHAKGPDKIRPALEKLFSERKGVQVKVALFDVNLASSGRAIIKGFAVFQRPGEENDEVLFTATYVKEKRAWKLSKVEEEESSVPLDTIAKLGELEWLIGDWVDQDESGSVAGTYYNTATDVARPVRGMVDKKTQRAAWTFSDGKNTDIIMETGLFNLTKDQTEALLHLGNEKTQKYLMVRLDEPKDSATAKEGQK
jgi:uncharacterized protein (TIGR02246 family)